MQRRWISIALTLCIAAVPAWADGTKKKPQKPAHAEAIASCVGAGPLLPLKAADQRTLLEPDDRDRVYEAILARYTVLRGHDLAPRQIMLWRKSHDEWLYVHLAQADKAQPGGLCFTATVHAADFEFTGALIQKYFYPGASPA
jgi:hypothetical protein